MLKINHIVKHFERITALDNISLTINDGEFFGLLGPNGAGKTTLMNIIIGFTLPTSGSISIDGQIMTFEDINLRKKFGYVPQDISLYLELTTEMNLKIFGGFYELSGKLLKKKIDEVLELVQLTERRKDKVGEFSGGMKRRLNIAASLLHNPQILLCDEPTVGVDPQSRNAIFDLLYYLNKTGKTILYTTHYMEEAERLCSRLAIIDHGKIIQQGTNAELISILNHKDVIKIQKTPYVEKNIDKIKMMGKVNDLEYVYELFPSEAYCKKSKIFAEFELLEIPDNLIEIERATLEDVFLNLTGRRLRD